MSSLVWRMLTSLQSPELNPIKHPWDKLDWGCYSSRLMPMVLERDHILLAKLSKFILIVWRFHVKSLSSHWSPSAKLALVVGVCRWCNGWLWLQSRSSHLRPSLCALFFVSHSLSSRHTLNFWTSRSATSERRQIGKKQLSDGLEQRRKTWGPLWRLVRL